ncbi:acid phosphatase-domain-containing protein [Crepidotus variabilis]|uniref:Acid phosphatase-domain-containing protein n=1 Tax=Crepidotus variabilis TaxID=179855 RepID=A0A9P6JLE1_9AGAR|nr:acid phosphatase-domain-containing protein [Crepidotus variabilis]
MSYPKIVALDTDVTIWKGSLDWSWGHEDNIERVDRWLLRDKRNYNKQIRIYDDISAIVSDVLKNGAKLAIVSRTSSKALSDRALYYFNTINTDGKEWSIIHLVTYDEVVNESKANHFRRIHGWSNNDYSEMLLFDDEGINNVVRVELGVSYQIIPYWRGLNWAGYQKGLNVWRRSQKLVIPSTPGYQRRPNPIGYTGLPKFWIDLVNKGEGIVDRSADYRWGYGLYVTDSLGIAKRFRNWERQEMRREAYVCAVYIRDFYTWVGLDKIWVPEYGGGLVQMSNRTWTEEHTGLNQENRDARIADQWGVQTPYVLFSRHFWFPTLPIPQGQRWNEMLLSTQVMRTNIYIEVLSDAEADRKGEFPPYQDLISTWKITVPAVTRQEFLSKREMSHYNRSA